MDLQPSIAFDDHDSERAEIFSAPEQALASVFPMENERYRLHLKNVHYANTQPYTLHDQKEALLSNHDLSQALKGTWELEDKASGSILERKTTTVARIPYRTERGTFIRNGAEYTVSRQSRLKPGAYTRRKESGELETHFNVERGSGRSFRVMMEPSTGQFKVLAGQASLPLAAVLAKMGVTEKEMHEAWGPGVYQANQKREDPKLSAKLAAHFLAKKDAEAEQTPELLRGVFERMRLDPRVTRYTLGEEIDRVSPAAILKATSKLMAVNRGEADTDDRDALGFQTLHSTADFLREKFQRDAGGVMRRLLWKITAKGNLSPMAAGALDPHVNALFSSSFANPLEEINPLEILDQQYRVVRLGEGGIPSAEAIPSDSRMVQPSQLGVIDPIRAPESEKVGVDSRTAWGARRRGNQFVTRLLDRTGQQVEASPEDMMDAVIAFPGEMKDPNKQKVRVMHAGKIRTAGREEVDFTIPSAQSMFSLGANLIPLLNSSKGHRLLMGSKMLTQALPLREGEAPLVQSAMPDDPNDSFERLVGGQMGAVSAKGTGQVIAVTPENVRVHYADGTTHDHQLYNSFPLNRKVFISNTALVQPGQVVQPGQLLAKSNFTNEKGALALGKNLLVAYAPYKGNYEDAIVVSESAARRLSSEHMYTAALGKQDQAVLDKAKYLGLYPGRFKAQQLQRIGSNGVVKPGTVVQPGDPLILATAERKPTGASNFYRPHRLQPVDKAVTWDHADAGEVTDVRETKDGWKVAVKAYAPAQVGDKMCFDPLTRILTRSGWKYVEAVTLDDEIATLNQDTGELEWQKPTHLWAYDHDGPMYRLETKHINMLVTPNHRLWVAPEGEKFRAVTAEELFASRGRWQFKKDCSWRGEEKEWIHFDTSAYKPRANSCVLKKAKMDDWLEFLGYYVAEGWCSLNGVGSKYVKIGQYPKSPHTKKIAALLERLGLRFGYDKKDGRFIAGNRWLYDLLAPLGNSLTMRVPSFVQDLSPRQIGIFFNAYMNGDGHRGALWEYSTSSEGMAYDIQLLCMKLGWSVRVKEVTRTDNWAKHRHWRGRVNRRQLQPWLDKTRIRARRINKEELVDYKGKVYCVTVPNHTVYIERESKTYWSLNSGRYG